MHVIICQNCVFFFYKKIIAKSLSDREIHSQIPLPPLAVGLVIRPPAIECLRLAKLAPQKNLPP